MEKQQRKIILICSSDSFYLWYKSGKLFFSEKYDGCLVFLCKLYDSFWKNNLSKLRLFQRLLRLVPRCGIFYSETQAVISVHGMIMGIDIEKRTVVVEHYFRSGMNNPLSFSRLKGVHGFDDGIYYGEYFGNTRGDSVKIYKRNSESEWQIVYEFPRQSVNHIHKIVPDNNNHCVYVLTGDSDCQSGIWRFTDSFKVLDKKKVGRQQLRSCVAFPYMSGLIYATDTPLEKNYIYYLPSFDSEPIMIKEIEGPCIYGKMISNNRYAFSTSVEPDSRKTGWNYRLSHKLGPGVLSRYSKVYYGGLDVGFHEVMSGKKDFLPMVLFGFGTFLFPDTTHDNSFIVLGQGIRKYDGISTRLRL